MNNTVWLALRMAQPVEVLGIFSTEDKARAVCIEWYDVIGPIAIDEELPDVDWPGAYYPLAAQKADGAA